MARPFASYGMPEWGIRCFPQPFIIAPFPNATGFCLCSWAWAPRMTGDPKNPFLIKMPNRLCQLHTADYYGSPSTWQIPEKAARKTANSTVTASSASVTRRNAGEPRTTRKGRSDKGKPRRTRVMATTVNLP